MLVFTANPEDYTARGKIITPLKDRIGSEIRTHYPATRAATRWRSPQQEAWTDRAGRPEGRDSRSSCARWSRKWRSRRAPTARSTSAPASASGCRSPRSSSSSRTPSGARSRNGETLVVPRVTDLYAALPSITGKFELEYEGELRGAEQVARDLIRSAVGIVFTGMFDGVDTRTVVEWFDLGGSLPLSDVTSADEVDRADRAASRGCASWPSTPASPPGAPAPAVASAIDFVLEGPVRAEEDQPQRRARLRGRRPSRRRGAAPRREEPAIDEEIRMPGGKKKYYN